MGECDQQGHTCHNLHNDRTSTALGYHLGHKPRSYSFFPPLALPPPSQKTPCPPSLVSPLTFISYTKNIAMNESPEPIKMRDRMPNKAGSTGL